MNADDFDLRLAQRELRQACHHEAAHELLVHMFGGFGDIRIWPNDSQASIEGQEKAWRGQFRLMVKPGAVGLSDEHKERFGVLAEPPANWERLVGLAGLVSEYMADGELDPQDIAMRIEDSVAFGEVSDTDHALMGEDWGEEDVAEVVRLLTSRWADLMNRAAELEKFAKE